MAKITRANQKIFAGSATPSGNVAQIGSTVTGTPVYTNDPDSIQALSAYLTGLAAQVVNGTDSPVLQEENAFKFLVTRQLAYLLQQGIAEWNSATTYYMYSFCSSGGNLYRSVTNDNAGNAVTDTNNWTKWPINYDTLTANVASLMVEGILAWSSSTTYTATSVVKQGAIWYRSLQASNLNHSPSSSPTWWAEYPANYTAVAAVVSSLSVEGILTWSNSVTYSATSFTKYNGALYRSLQAANLNKNPASQTTWWALYPTASIPAITGQIIEYAGSDLPTGFLVCNGSVHNVSSYPTLGALLLGIYGGNGTTTFAVPDKRGRVGVGLGTGVGTNWTLGRKAGAETVVLGSTEMPIHTHTLSPSPQGSSRDFGDVGSLIITSNLEPNGSFPVPSITGSAGGSQPHNNLQPSIGIQFLIKT